MTVGGIKATCPNSNCDYSIDDNRTPILNAYTISTNIMTLTF